MDPYIFSALLICFFIYLRERSGKAFAEGGKSGVGLFNSGIEHLYSKAASICQPLAVWYGYSFK